MKSKALVFGNPGLGDVICQTIPLLRALKKKFDEVYVFSANLKGHQLVRHTPYFSGGVPIFNIHSMWNRRDITEGGMFELFLDISKCFDSYDQVYIPLKSLFNRFHELLEPHARAKLAKRSPRTNPIPRTQAVLSDFDLDPEPLELDLNWYSKYHKDFRLNPNTVLLNCQSSSERRSYSKSEELKFRLIKEGFDVIEIDPDNDIRENLFLIKQVQYILTVDTATLWMGKALNKEPYVFISFNGYKPNIDNFNFLEIKQMLGVDNILREDCSSLDEVAPEAIIDGFLRATEKRHEILSKS